VTPPALDSPPRPYKVLHVGKYYPPHMGGIETHLQTLCSLLKQFVPLDVLVFADDRRTMTDTVEGVEVTRLGKSLDLAGAPVSWELIKRLRQTDAAIVHLHLPNPFATLAYLASGHKGHLFISYHGEIVRQRVLSLFYAPVLDATLSRAHSILVATSDHIVHSPTLLKHQKRCRVVPYGIPARHFLTRLPEQADIIRKNGSLPLILSVGRLVYYKGFDVLIRAMGAVNARLIIIGDGPLRGELEALSESLGLSDRVTILGGVPDVRPYYQACAFFVLPSVARSEAFGIVQLEAMASGKSVINTRLPSGVPSVSIHDETGLTVPPSDPEALSRAMNRLLSDPVLRGRFERAAVERVGERFTGEKMAWRTLELYDQAISES